MPTCRKPVLRSESIWTFTTEEDHIRAWEGRRRIRSTSMRRNQSRLRHNQRQKPLIKLPQTVQTNQATSVVVPADCVKRLPEKINLVARREKVILDLCADPDFSVDHLRKALAAARDIH